MPVVNVPGMWGNLAAGLQGGVESYQQRRQQIEQEKQQSILQTIQMLNSGMIDTPTASQRLQAAGWTGQIQPSEKDLRRSVLQGGLGNATQEQALAAGLGGEWDKNNQRPASQRARKIYLKRNYPELGDTEINDIATDDASFTAFEMQSRYVRPTYDARRGQLIDPRTGQATTPEGITAPVNAPRSGGGGGGGGGGSASADLKRNASLVGQQITETNQRIRAFEAKDRQVPPELTTRRDSLVAVRDGIAAQMQAGGRATTRGGGAAAPASPVTPARERHVVDRIEGNIAVVESSTPDGRIRYTNVPVSQLGGGIREGQQVRLPSAAGGQDAAYAAELAELTKDFNAVKNRTNEHILAYNAQRQRIAAKYGK